MYYAVTYAYGRHVLNNGHRADLAYRFNRRADRDAFMLTCVCDCEPIRTTHPALRQLLRNTGELSERSWRDGIPIDMRSS